MYCRTADILWHDFFFRDVWLDSWQFLSHEYYLSAEVDLNLHKIGKLPIGQIRNKFQFYTVFCQRGI